MLENQVKNTIKLIIAAILATVLGEGVLGLGLYWPFLMLLLEWDGIFWLSLFIGVLISVFNGLPIGFPSLILVAMFGIFSVIFGGRRDMTLLMIVALVLANFIFDKLLGLNYGWVEFIIVIGFSLLVLGWGEKNESIHIKYR